MNRIIFLLYTILVLLILKLIYCIVLLLAHAIIGGLVSDIQLLVEIQADYSIKEAAMSQYEFLDLLFTAIQILIDIITRLRQKRQKGKRNKK